MNIVASNLSNRTLFRRIVIGISPLRCEMTLPNQVAKSTHPNAVTTFRKAKKTPLPLVITPRHAVLQSAYSNNNYLKVIDNRP
ncbi:MAG: hypothetical protein KDJ65_00920 [Anaerolineae bacterium]|nr:hypothetical protein [Anaerolineae bacterium]